MTYASSLSRNDRKPMIYSSTKQHVSNHSPVPDSFLDTIIAWGKTAPDSLFEPNDLYDIYSLVYPQLGPWRGEVGSPERTLHRKAVMLEVMRCHAAFESDWNWNEGVDTNNLHSLTHITGAETGIFQVSADSMELDASLRDFILERLGTTEPHVFITAMKADHVLALDYYARLVRVNIRWAGPLLVESKVRAWLKRDAVDEFSGLLVPDTAGT